MKAIVRFVLVLGLVCGAAFAWKAVDRKARRFQLAEDAGARPKGEADPLAEAMEHMQTGHAAKAQSLWSKSDFQSKLEEAFQKNDPCAVVELVRAPRDVSPREMWSAGMAVLLSQARERASVLEELLASAESPVYGLPQESSKAREVRFLSALIYAGLMREADESEGQPRRHPHRNLEKAIDLLKGLVQEDPENGAFGFFLATALKQNGTKKEETQGAFNQASRAPHFDPLYQRIYDSLLRAAYGNAATFAFAYLFLETVPVPDYNPGIRSLKWWAHNEDSGRWIAQRLAKRLIELGASYKAKSPGYLFPHAEYILGHNLRYTVDGRMENNWKDYSERMHEAETFISEKPPAVAEAEVSLYRDKIEVKKSCGPDAWKALFAANKGKISGEK